MVLNGCGLSLEGVAEVDQEGLLDKGVLRLDLKRLQSFSNEGTRTSLGVQLPGGPGLCLWASNAGGTTSTPGHRINILHTM